MHELIHEVMALYQERRFDSAADRCMALLKTAPQDADLWNLLGVSLLGLDRFEEAIEAFSKAIEQRPTGGDIYNNLGVALFRFGRKLEAEAAYRRAIQLDPENGDAHRNLGVVLTSLGRSREALASLQEAERLLPNNAAVCNSLGVLLMEENRLDEAEKVLRRSIAIDPVRIQTHLNLGFVLERKNRTVEALEVYDRILTLHPNDVRTYYRLAELRTAHPGDPRFDRLEQLKDADLSPAERANLYFALGRMYENVGAYDAAFQHYREGNENRKVRPDQDYSPETQTRYVDALIREINQNIFQRFTGNPSRRPIWIVGMPRSGTTLVEQILSNHPEVCAGGELLTLGEISNRAIAGADFGTALATLNNETLAKDAVAYLERLARIDRNSERVTDKLPENYFALWYAALLFPNAHIVHVARDPRDTGISCYFTHFEHGHGWANDLGTLAAFYRDYQRLMEHWEKVLPIPLYTVRYEDLVQNPEPVVRALLENLGLEWEPACLEPHRNPSAVRTASLLQVRKGIYSHSVGRWRHYEAHLGPLATLTPPER